jgi:hypothetical protein
MPVGEGRFRVKTMPSGAKVRLHFTPKGQVNEAKNLESGATHSPADFRKDKRRDDTRKLRRGR